MDILFRLLANTADGAFVIDEEQRIVYWNPAAQEILGYEAEEVLGRACHEILGGCDEQGKPVCCPGCYISIAALAGDQVTNYHIAARTKSGERRWLNVSILAGDLSENQSSPGLVHLFRDATVAKQNEQFVHQMVNAVERLQTGAPAPAPSPPAATPAADLTAREREVLSLLGRGLNTQDIAQSLSISTSTVRNHVQNILNKLQVHSRLEAVAYAFEHGLIDTE